MMFLKKLKNYIIIILDIKLLYNFYNINKSHVFCYCIIFMYRRPTVVRKS